MVQEPVPETPQLVNQTHDLPSIVLAMLPQKVP